LAEPQAGLFCTFLPPQHIALTTSLTSLHLQNHKARLEKASLEQSYQLLPARLSVWVTGTEGMCLQQQNCLLLTISALGILEIAMTIQMSNTSELARVTDPVVTLARARTDLNRVTLTPGPGREESLPHAEKSEEKTSIHTFLPQASELVLAVALLASVGDLELRLSEREAISLPTA
jgi:hypothetical protein